MKNYFLIATVAITFFLGLLGQTFGQMTFGQFEEVILSEGGQRVATPDTSFVSWFGKPGDTLERLLILEEERVIITIGDGGATIVKETVEGDSVDVSIFLFARHKFPGGRLTLKLEMLHGPISTRLIEKDFLEIGYLEDILEQVRRYRYDDMALLSQLESSLLEEGHTVDSLWIPGPGGAFTVNYRDTLGGITLREDYLVSMRPSDVPREEQKSQLPPEIYFRDSSSNFVLKGFLFKKDDNSLRFTRKNQAEIYFFEEKIGDETKTTIINQKTFWQKIWQQRNRFFK